MPSRRLANRFLVDLDLVNWAFSRCASLEINPRWN